MKAYLAYGANTNFAQMNVRCPGAIYVCNVNLNNFRLTFRGVADVVPHKGSKAVCALWLITPENEAALDGFEGFPRFYVKRYATLRLNGKRHRVMFYVMRSPQGQCEPSESYEACLRAGYADCGMPEKQIDEAIQRALTATHRIEDRSSWARRDAEAAAAQDADDAANEAAGLDLLEWYEGEDTKESA